MPGGEYRPGFDHRDPEADSGLSAPRGILSSTAWSAVVGRVPGYTGAQLVPDRHQPHSANRVSILVVSDVTAVSRTARGEHAIHLRSWWQG